MKDQKETFFIRFAVLFPKWGKTLCKFVKNYLTCTAFRTCKKPSNYGHCQSLLNFSADEVSNRTSTFPNAELQSFLKKKKKKMAKASRICCLVKFLFFALCRERKHSYLLAILTKKLIQLINQLNYYNSRNCSSQKIETSNFRANN